MTEDVSVGLCDIGPKFQKEEGPLLPDEVPRSKTRPGKSSVSFSMHEAGELGRQAAPGSGQVDDRLVPAMGKEQKDPGHSNGGTGSSRVQGGEQEGVTDEGVEEAPQTKGADDVHFY